MIRTGLGWDMHRLTLQPGGRGLLTLAGVPIPSDRTLVAHSDGDVILHALTDSLLGAIGSEEDLGSLFPPTDPKYRGLSSLYFLNEALKRLQKANWTILNVDVICVAEKPKLSEYRLAMKRQLAHYLQLVPEKIAVKIKSAEKLDAIGKGDAIASWVTTTIFSPELFASYAKELSIASVK